MGKRPKQVERGGGLALSVALLIFGLNWVVPKWFALRPPFAATALATVLGVPAFTALTAVLRGLTPARDGLRLWVAEVFSLLVHLLVFPFMWLIIPLQMLGGMSALIGLAVLGGLSLCVVQNLLHATWGLMKDWKDIGGMALYASGLLVVSLPVMWLAERAEAASMDLYPWLVEKVRRFESGVQARLFGDPNPPESFDEEDDDT